MYRVMKVRNGVGRHKAKTDSRHEKKKDADTRLRQLKQSNRTNQLKCWIEDSTNDIEPEKHKYRDVLDIYRPTKTRLKRNIR